MNILYLGDIMARPGIEVVGKLLPGLRRQYAVDLVVAQAENVSDGKGMTVSDYQILKGYGVDAFTGGNWSLHREELHSLLADPNAPVLRPANYPLGTPGKQFKYVNTPKGKVLVVSLLGKIVGKDADKPINNPLEVIDDILQQADADRVATVVNFHGDFSSEKVVIGHYLDGRVTMVVGDHWHVPTADARVLPKGTAHMTDVGMCGTLNSSLGVKLESIIPRWHDSKPTPNLMASEGPFQLSGLLVAVNQNGLAESAQHILTYLD